MWTPYCAAAYASTRTRWVGKAHRLQGVCVLYNCGLRPAQDFVQGFWFSVSFPWRVQARLSFAGWC